MVKEREEQEGGRKRPGEEQRKYTKELKRHAQEKTDITKGMSATNLSITRRGKE